MSKPKKDIPPFDEQNPWKIDWLEALAETFVGIFVIAFIILALMILAPKSQADDLQLPQMAADQRVSFALLFDCKSLSEGNRYLECIVRVTSPIVRDVTPSKQHEEDHRDSLSKKEGKHQI